ncbi:MAG: complex I subunit 5 family protein [Halanaerobiaceae bacterium]
MMNLSVLLLILVPLSTAFLIPLVDLFSIRYRKFLVVISGLTELYLTFSILFNNLERLKNGDFYLEYHLGGWLPPSGINLAVDGLSFLFSFLVTLAMILIIIYSIGFIGHHEGKYFVLTFLILGAMQGIVVTGDMFNLYVFIELLAITTSALVAFKRNQDGTEAAIKYALYGIMAGVFFFLGIILIYMNLGTLNMGEISAGFAGLDFRVQLLISIFFLTSLLLKLGIFPFHFWMAKAYSACPSSISALLSGIVSKVYVYIFIRLFFVIFSYSLLQDVALNRFVLYLAIFSGFLGHILALQAEDIKRLLAFSSVGHMGMIVGVIFLNTAAGFIAGLLHVVSHFLMKSALFTCTGYLLQFTPGHRIVDNEGVAYKNRPVFISFITASMGMIGIPPLIGFVSKWYILLAFLEEGIYPGVVLVVGGSLLAMVYYFRFFSHGLKKIEVGKPRKERHVLKVFYREKVVTSVVFVFTGLVVFAGIFSRVLDLPLDAAVRVLLRPENYSVFFLGG